MASHVIQIARQEGTEFRSVYLALEDDGAITSLEFSFDNLIDARDQRLP